MPDDDLVSVRYMVDDVDDAIDFYTAPLRLHAAPQRGAGVRGRHSRQAAAAAGGPESSAGRPMPDGRTPGPGGWNRIHLDRR